MHRPNVIRMVLLPAYPWLLVIASQLCGVAKAHADGYTARQNESIWRSRVSSRELAHKDAAKKCDSAEQKSDFMDELEGDTLPEDGALFLDLMKWLRLDQNARSVYDAFGDVESREKVREVDAVNLTHIRTVLSRGFPSLSEVGYQGSNAALVLAIHADADPVFQKEALSKVEEAAKQKEIPGSFPLIFKVVRSKVAGRPTTKVATEPPPASTSAATKEDCFRRAYGAFFNEYMRKLLPVDVHK